MSHIAPRPPQRPAHRQTRSNSQTLDPRLELVGKLEGCIGKILEATKAYKSPQQQHHTAHQNANQMFQQRVMASRGQMGNMSDQDWLGTMMQCLNESMRTQQSSFVRNTTLDVALRTFAAGIFEALGPAYFQEPLDKYLAASKPMSPQNTIAGHYALDRSGIPSPPREMGPNRSILQRLGTQNIPPSPTHASPFPSTHYQMVQRSAHSVSPNGAPAPQHQMRAMPILQRPLPPARQPRRPPKRSSPTEPLNPLAQKRTYTSETLRQAAGSMGPLLSPAQAQPSHSNTLKPWLCIDFWDVQQERNSRRRQAILGYGGKCFLATKVQPHSLITTASCSTQSSEPASLPTERLETSRESPSSVSKLESREPLALHVARNVQSPERDEPVVSPEKSAKDSFAVTSTAKAPGTPENVEHIPELTPNSPESSDLSGPSSLADFDSIETQPPGSDPKIIDGKLEEGEIDESCIQVIPYSLTMSAKMFTSSESGNKKKKWISAAGSAAPSGLSSGLPRKKLPSTPKSAQTKKKKRERQSFWSPSQETGPSAHDQFKTRACKQCAERFYFRAQLATHMQTEHAEIITVE
ncbi:uncharacterized protein BBA_06679 [Beauveria bassiana ARSEF 2860]|uniref:C2H2-type domain-containing protein n=1 Tax=Beauveria bassiana (strain ARSEF 2860) TaxID=655819 RepID=J4UJX9_BEAB2|nr:uncharacterized protein BBA_06679 [Beauveria bassiana ARSEF 2860]EJP64297.1 hypothetical protein BBA_06679 [Beauveria bassiana ARSEF 2860]